MQNILVYKNRLFLEQTNNLFDWHNYLSKDAKGQLLSLEVLEKMYLYYDKLLAITIT